MFQFVYWLKAIAAIFITNSHYANIWPVSALAFGGHLGNCLYFFVSGFCLYHIRESFPKWYLKRAVRIYPSLWLAAAIFLLIGWYRIDTITAGLHCLIYPTWFHFIGSIMLLYVFFYLWRKIVRVGGTFSGMMIALGAFLLAYLFFFDKSYYHIDNVEEKWVRFQFAEAMLMGVWFREKYDSFSGRPKWFDWASVPAMLVVYLISKIAVSRFASFSVIQFIHPLVLLLLIYRIAVLAVKLEKLGFFTSVNGCVVRVVRFLSEITLEIYLVQYPIIAATEHLPFPVNFIVTTAGILLCAWVLHEISKRFQTWFCKLVKL